MDFCFLHTIHHHGISILNYLYSELFQNHFCQSQARQAFFLSKDTVRHKICHPLIESISIYPFFIQPNSKYFFCPLFGKFGYTISVKTVGSVSCKVHIFGHHFSDKYPVRNSRFVFVLKTAATFVPLPSSLSSPLAVSLFK